MQVDKPEFLEHVRRAARSGQNPIVIHNNVEDDVVIGKKVLATKDAVMEELDVVGHITYTLAGWQFDSDETETAFRRVCGLPLVPEPTTVPTDPEPGESGDAFLKRQANAIVQDQLYKEFQPLVEAGAKRGKTPVQCLAPVPAELGADLLREFITTRFVPDAVDDNGNPYPNPEEYAVVLDWAAMTIPHADVSQQKDEQKRLEVILNQACTSGQKLPPIIILTPSKEDLSANVFGRGTVAAVIEAPVPDYYQRLGQLKALHKEFHYRLNGTPMESLAHMSAGLSNRHLRSIVCEAVSWNQPVDDQLIGTRKQDILSDELGGIVEVVRPTFGFELIGGLDEAKTVLHDVVRYIKEEKTPLVPMGVLLLGPPGTGKSAIAEAFAEEVGYNFIRPGQVKSKWVGESERNIAKLFDVARSLAPVVIFYDEFDSESNRGAEGDSGVSKHIFSTMLRFMSDTSLRGRVVTIAASNRPDLIDAAMKRPGRFDIRIPILYPDVAERAAIFQVMFNKYGLHADAGMNYEELARESEDYSGADIECVVLEAARISERRDRYPRVSMNDLFGAMQSYLLNHDVDAIKKMERLALQECNSVEMLPERYRDSATKQLNVTTEEVN